MQGGRYVFVTLITTEQIEDVEILDIYRKSATIDSEYSGTFLGNFKKHSSPEWWNGRRAGLKIRCPSGRVGSTPTSGTMFVHSMLD